MSKVPTKPLFALCRSDRSICYGIVQPGKPHPKGVPIVRVNNFRDNSLDLADVLLVDPQIEKKFSRSRPTPGDVLVTLVGTIGQVAIAPPEIAGWNVARAVAVVPVRDAHHAEWVYFALQTPEAQNFIHQHANTTVQATFNLRDLAALPIPYPSQYRREAALRLLSSLRQKIELNRQMNKTLEAMAQAIFRDWFVDFGPTRRKLAGITDPVEIMGGLVQDATHAAELAALFPNALGDDGLPEGWEKKPVGELAYIRGGKQLPKDEFDPAGNVPIFGGAGLMGFTNKSNADGFVITIGRVGAYCGKLFTYRGRAWVNNNASQFIPKSSVPPEWLYLSLCQLDIHNIRRGAAQPFVSNSDLAALSVVVPDDSILPQFMWLVTPIIIKSEQAASESRILAATRDLLLPKLMSGEIRLREAEKIAEAAP